MAWGFSGVSHSPHALRMRVRRLNINVPSAVHFYHVNERAQSRRDQAAVNALSHSNRQSSHNANLLQRYKLYDNRNEEDFNEKGCSSRRSGQYTKTKPRAARRTSRFYLYAGWLIYK